MKILYIDAPMGISGDMFLAALIDLGVGPAAIRRELKKLPLTGRDYSIRIEKAVRSSITATSFLVKVKKKQHPRTYRDIRRLIKEADLSPDTKTLALDIFRTIALAEAKVHGTRPESVHFHEVGAVDSIVDIVGAAAAVAALGADAVFSSPVALGSGWTDTMHGRLPVPAPATLEILKGVPVEAGPAPFELTTPTGAAIIKTLAKGFGPMPDMTVEATGHGAGKKDFSGAANVLRAVLGRTEKRPAPLYELTTNLDDMRPQLAGYLLERLFEAGSSEAYFTPIQMKKTRPGVLLTVLVPEERKEEVLDVIFRESTTIGVRVGVVERYCLERKMAVVKTPYGTVRVKVSMKEGEVVNIQPEYEDCRALALKKKVPLKRVMDEAGAAALRIRT